MFVDQARIYVKGGDGGNGIVSYRREKFVPLGGPAGGDGGHGGDVVFIVDEGLRTLIDFRYQRHFKAKHGENGKTKNQHGRNATDMLVKVPPGTVIRDTDTDEFLGDLVHHGQRLVVAKGGQGGRGNTRFATEANKAPDMAEKGEPGQERNISLELKVLADVGLVGYPSVGKSTLLAAVSAAKPKVGAYHFTTLSPELGVVRLADGRHFVMADLPGLIEGAHSGLGLGHEFLRHIERTKVLVHVIDMAAVDGRNPVEDFRVIEQELFAYDEKLKNRSRIVVANKTDLPEAFEHLEAFRKEFPEITVYPVSGYTHQGIEPLLYALMKMLDELPKEVLQFDVEESPEALSKERKIYKFKKKQPFTIKRDNEVYVVVSDDLEKLVLRMNFTQYDALKRFQHILKVQGVEKALHAKGAKDGDTVRIGDMEFDFVE
jgi:GTPase